jgi:5-methylcytosine-specific restriction endonuclease McrA
MPTRLGRRQCACGALTSGRRCVRCSRLIERRRGSAFARGYDGAHRRVTRTVIAEWVARYGWLCPGWGRPPHPVSEGGLVGAHLVHMSAGGRSEKANMSVLCPGCNSREVAMRTRGIGV